MMASCATAERATTEPRKRPAASDFDMVSIRTRIETVDTNRLKDTTELIDYYRVLDTIQQRYINELEASRKNIIHKTEWVNWLKEDTSVFFRQWSNYAIPQCLASQIEIYTLIGSVKHYMDAIDESIASVRKENPRLSEENLKPVIRARVSDLMDEAETLLAQLNKRGLKEMLPIEQYEFYSTQRERYNTIAEKY